LRRYNTGSRGGGAITAALFLQKYIDKAGPPLGPDKGR
jgi:leucyl aminopeptidase